MVQDGNASAPFRVVIVGGGVAGLALAAFLRQRTSFHIQVVEMRDLRESSAAETDYGVAIASNGVAVLAELGIRDAVKELRGGELTQISTCPAAVASSPAHIVPFPSRILYGNPSIFTRRSSTIAWLLGKCKDELPGKAPVELVCPRRIASVDVERGTATDDGGVVHAADLLVCADGIAKTGRRAMIAALDGGKDDGASEEVVVQAAYMTVVPLSAIQARPSLHHLLPDGQNGTLSNWVYDEPAANVTNDAALASRLQRRIIMYPLDSVGNHQIFAYRPASDDVLQRFGGSGGEGSRRRSIIRGVPAEEALAMFDQFHPEVQSLLGLQPTLDLCLIRDSDPVSCWSYGGKAVMIGDAAHATIPHTGQGFSQSLEDAEALAQLLASAEPSQMGTALKAFESIRLPRAHEVQLTSRLMNGTRAGLDRFDQQRYFARILAGWKRTELGHT